MVRILTRALCTVFLIASQSAGVVSARGWKPSYEAAEAASAASAIPLLIHFHAAYCGPCRQMEKQVFTSPAVQQALDDGLSAVKVDIQDRTDLKTRFEIETVPCDIVVYPDGSVETLSVGFVPRSSWLAMLRDAAARGRIIALNRLEPESRSDYSEIRPAAEIPMWKETDGEVVGLGGFCPVMLAGWRKWVQGNSEISAHHRGIEYHFSNVKAREEFVKDRVRYAPRNLGCDPVLLLNEQRAVTGSIRFGVFFDGKLYLFRSNTTRREFRSNPSKYTRIQHAIRPAQLWGQTFR